MQFSGELLINLFIPNTPLHDGASLFAMIKSPFLVPTALDGKHWNFKSLGRVTAQPLVYLKFRMPLPLVSEETGRISVIQWNFSDTI